MKLNLSKFKKVGSDKEFSTLRHEDGHEIKIKHSALLPANRKELISLPSQKAEPIKAKAYDDGGPVTPDPTPNASPDQDAAPSDDSSSYQALPDPTQDIPQDAPQPVPQAAPVQQQAPDTYGTNAAQQAFLSGIKEQTAGLDLARQAAEVQGAAQAQAANNYVAAQQTQALDYQTHLKDVADEHNRFVQDYVNGHIDPNAYLENMSIPGRVSTAIGMILGGAGAGVTGGPNPALDFLNRQIDRNIDAQKADLGKKATLLEANLRQYGNLRDASDMARIQQQGIYGAQVAEAGAKAMGPMAKANALQAKGEIDQKTANDIGQFAMRRTILGAANAGQVSPEMVVQAYIPQGQREAYMKELQTAENATSLKNDTLQAFDQVAKLNTLANRVGSPLQNPRQIAAIQGTALDKLTKDTSGRVTPETVSLVKDIFSKMGNNSQTNQVARARLSSMLSQNMHFPLLEGIGIRKYSQPSEPIQGPKLNPLVIKK